MRSSRGAGQAQGLCRLTQTWLQKPAPSPPTRPQPDCTASLQAGVDTPSAHDHPSGCIPQRSTRPQTTLAGSGKRATRCIVRMFGNCFCVKSRRKLLQRSAIPHHDVLERLPSPQHCCAAQTSSEVPTAGAIHGPLCPPRSEAQLQTADTPDTQKNLRHRAARQRLSPQFFGPYDA